jgi:hypothetical protein
VNHSHSREKGFGHRIQSDNLASDWTNWRFREAQVGPTILLKPLLAQNYYSMHDFLGGIGAQDSMPILTVVLIWCLRRRELVNWSSNIDSYNNCHAGNQSQEIFTQQIQQ